MHSEEKKKQEQGIEALNKSEAPMAELEENLWELIDNSAQPTATVAPTAEPSEKPAEFLDNSERPTATIEPTAELEENTVELVDNSEPSTATVKLKAELVDTEVSELSIRVAELQLQEQALKQEIATLQAAYNTMLQSQVTETQATLGRLVQEALKELEQSKQALQISVEQLEKRRDRIREEMRKSFAGVSQELAIRVQGFKDYLVGSLQDLASAAEQLELPIAKEPTKPTAPRTPPEGVPAAPSPTNPKFAENTFQGTVKQIRGTLDRYRNQPDYYGPPWQLRRTFEPVHAERVSNWFFTQGGRGTVRTMGSRLQNILITSAIISVLHNLYADRLRTLVLANTPERLGEWRRGLQDCLGISRSDFGPDRGVVLFEEAEPLVVKAERLIKQGQMPLIMIDETEEQINLSLLQFPLWLAFAPDPQQMTTDSKDFRF